jgi:hypothetical protein
MSHSDDLTEGGDFVGPPLLFLIKPESVVPIIETPTSHLRSALAHTRLAMDLGLVVHANDGVGIVVRLDVLDQISRRIEAAILIIELSKEVRS